MRLTIVLLIAGFLQVGAKGLSQTVTLHRTNTPLEMILTDIHRQTGYSFVYNLEWLAKVPNVSLSVDRMPLTDALDLLLKDQPVTYAFVDKTVVLKWEYRAPTTSPLSKPTPPEDPGVTLFVRSSKGQPLAGASVFFKRTHKGIITGANGQFSLDKLDVSDTLIISYVGYKTRYLDIAGFVQSTFPVIIMEESDDKLDQMVVQAYGTTSQRYATGNIARVSGEEIAKQPVSNPLLALQGRVAGMTVSVNNGYQSGPVKLEIRGRNSLDPNFPSDPLYIVDGVPINPLNIDGLSSYANGSTGLTQSGFPAPAGGQSPFFNINPNDIESIEVLKDAAATAIYGSRGANGVLLITTKKGHANGRTELGANVRAGSSRVDRYWKMLDTHDYLAMRREAFRNDGITPTISNAPDLMLWDTTRYTDWQKLLWGHAGGYLEGNVTIDGSDVRTTFHLSGNYRRSTDILNYSGANTVTGLALSVSHHSEDNKFTAAATVNYSYSKVNNLFLPDATTLPPDAPPIFNSKGGLNYAPWDSAGIGYQFKFGTLQAPYSSSTYYLVSDLKLSYELMKGLLLSVNLGYNNSQNQTSTLFTIASQDPINNPTGTAWFGITNSRSYIVEPQLDYTRFLGRGKLSFLAGATINKQVSDGPAQYAYGYTDDALIHSVTNAGGVINSQNYAQYRYAAVFGRLNYILSNRYIFEVTGRRDGSSKFGPGKQFGNFGSGSIGWIASDEKWMKKILPKPVSFLKLRTTYGVVGSDAVPDYQYLSQWTNMSNYNPLFSYAGVNPLISQHAVNQDYHWQSTRQMEANLDLGFFKDRLTLGVAWYLKRCDNQLTAYPTPVFSGWPTVTANWPANVQNRGLEFTLNATILRTNDVNWSSMFTISANKNSLVSYPNIEKSAYVSKYKVGQSLNTMYLFHSTGVDPNTGQYTFTDLDHDGQIRMDPSVPPGTASDDRVASVDLNPSFFGGFINSVGYKSFRLRTVFSFYKQKGINAFAYGVTPGAMYNIGSAIYKDRWQGAGDKAAFARLTTLPGSSDAAYLQSDAVYSDASYIRLSTLSLSYDAPQRLIRHAKMQTCTFFIETSNLFVITGYKGIDPTPVPFGSLPQAKTIVAGVTLKF